MDTNAVEGKVKPALSELKSEPEMSSPGGSSSVQLFRYPRGKIQVVTHRGKKTAQLFCQPRKYPKNLQKPETFPSCTEISSAYSTNMFGQMETYSVVSNLSELSELSTLTNIDEDLITLKMKPNSIPQLHCAGNNHPVRNQTLKSKKQSNRRKKMSNCRPNTEEQTKVRFDEKLEERMEKLKSSYDKHIEHILQECDEKVQSLQYELARYEIDLTEIKVKLSSSEEAEKLSRRELESVTEVRNWYQERLGQIESSTDYSKRDETPPVAEDVKNQSELQTLQEENRELRRRLEEGEKRSLELEEITLKDQAELRHLTGVLESERNDRDVAERRALSYENLIREAQIRVVEIKEEKDSAYLELEKLSCLTEDLQEKVDYITGENKTVSKKNVELEMIIKSLKESSETNEIKANNLEKLIDLKEAEISTLTSSLVKSDNEKLDLLEKFTAEKGDLELIIEELKNVKINIQNNMNREEPPEEIQIEKNQELESQLNKQVLKILDLEASEIELSDTIENLNKDRDYLTKCLNDGLAEMKDTRKKYEEMKDKIGALEEKVEERDIVVSRLQEEKLKHERQLKGLHCALKTSFDHIKSLRKAIEESQPIQCYDVDNNSLDQLLSSTGTMPGSSLQSLKLSLFDLKENVRELNIELGSSSVTPNISSERETPSFLDKLQDISDSAGETPSLQLSSHSSLNSSPAHFIT